MMRCPGGGLNMVAILNMVAMVGLTQSSEVGLSLLTHSAGIRTSTAPTTIHAGAAQCPQSVVRSVGSAMTIYWWVCLSEAAVFCLIETTVCRVRRPLDDDALSPFVAALRRSPSTGSLSFLGQFRIFPNCQDVGAASRIIVSG